MGAKELGRALFDTLSLFSVVKIAAAQFYIEERSSQMLSVQRLFFVWRLACNKEKYLALLYCRKTTFKSNMRNL